MILHGIVASFREVAMAENMPASTPPPPPRPLPQPQPVAAQPTEEEHGDELVHLNFWQLPWVQKVLPFATSLAVHLAVIVVGVVAARTVQTIVEEVRKEQVIIPDATMVEGAEPGGIPNPGPGTDPNRRAEQDIDPTIVQSEGVADRRSESLTAGLLSAGGGESESGNVIGVGANTNAGLGRGIGLRSGSGIGAGTGDGGGPLAPFGRPGGGQGMGPRAPFVGMGGNATRVVYLCDGTGTMVGLRYALVKNELKKAVDVLKPIQSFSVIFFQDRGFETVDQNQLLPATPQNKRRAYDFLDQLSIKGQTDPLPAIRQAFKLNPELIYILSDGEFDNLVSYQEVLAEIATLNKDGKVRINTILFGDRDKRAEETLREIAAKHGGRFKFVTEAELDR